MSVYRCNILGCSAYKITANSNSVVYLDYALSNDGIIDREKFLRYEVKRCSLAFINEIIVNL